MNDFSFNNLSENVRAYLNYMEDPMTRTPTRIPDGDNRCTTLVRDGRQYSITVPASMTGNVRFCVMFPYYGAALWKSATDGHTNPSARYAYSLCYIFFDGSGEMVGYGAVGDHRFISELPLYRENLIVNPVAGTKVTSSIRLVSSWLKVTSAIEVVTDSTQTFLRELIAGHTPTDLLDDLWLDRIAPITQRAIWDNFRNRLGSRMFTNSTGAKCFMQPFQDSPANDYFDVEALQTAVVHSYERLTEENFASAVYAAVEVPYIGVAFSQDIAPGGATPILVDTGFSFEIEPGPAALNMGSPSPVDAHYLTASYAFRGLASTLLKAMPAEISVPLRAAGAVIGAVGRATGLFTERNGGAGRGRRRPRRRLPPPRNEVIIEERRSRGRGPRQPAIEIEELPQRRRRPRRRRRRANRTEIEMTSLNSRPAGTRPMANSVAPRRVDEFVSI